MSIFGQNSVFLLVYFIYGLGFFSMGIALVLESYRTPGLAERRELRPLALFGLMHGIHEWVEIYILQRAWLGQPFPEVVTWLRVIWLTLSFIPLIIFAFFILLPRYKPGSYQPYLVFGLFVLFLLIILINWRSDPQDMLGHFDALARYILAVPGGVLTGLALRYRAQQVKKETRLNLARCLNWAAIGFGVYGLTQIFVSSTSMFPAYWINAELFRRVTLIPIQGVRAAMSILITVELIRAIQMVDKERENQLLTAKQERLDALEQIHQDLLQRETMRRELLRHTVQAQEEERSRIARELHDETAQLLTAINLNLATLHVAAPRRAELTELINRLNTLSRQMSLGIYRMVHDLRPAQLDDLGLISALQYLAEQAKERMKMVAFLDVQGNRQRLDPLIETVIFRVAQESLTNVFRHAKTVEAHMRLVFDPGEIHFSVEDKGVGFEPTRHMIPPHGWGLEGMRERVEAVGGQFKVESAPGRGTLISVVVPVKQNVTGVSTG